MLRWREGVCPLQQLATMKMKSRTFSFNICPYTPFVPTSRVACDTNESVEMTTCTSRTTPCVSAQRERKSFRTIVSAHPIAAQKRLRQGARFGRPITCKRTVRLVDCVAKLEWLNRILDGVTDDVKQEVERADSLLLYLDDDDAFGRFAPLSCRPANRGFMDWLPNMVNTSTPAQSVPAEQNSPARVSAVHTSTAGMRGQLGAVTSTENPSCRASLVERSSLAAVRCFVDYKALPAATYSTSH